MGRLDLFLSIPVQDHPLERVHGGHWEAGAVRPDGGGGRGGAESWGGAGGRGGRTGEAAGGVGRIPEPGAAAVPSETPSTQFGL